jgi:hypothetical protein
MGLIFDGANPALPSTGGASLSNATPAALGSAAAGTSPAASRADHVHAAVTASGISDASAAGREILTAADEAAQRTAMGVAARTASAYALDTGQGWTIVAPSSGNAAGSAATFPGAGVGRFTLSNSGAMDGLTGPRIERAISVTARQRWRIRVTPAALSGTSGNPTAAIYVRNSAGTAFVCVSALATADPSDVYVLSQAGEIDTAPLSGSCPWDGTCSLEIRYTDAGLLSCGVIAADGRFRLIATSVANSVLGFAPSHVGILGKAGIASAGVLDFSGFVFEVME